jgi:hypothetical protein
MKTTMRLATILATLIVLPSLFLFTPTATAEGNCIHYGEAGWGQVFTDYNYQGDCFEWRLGAQQNLPNILTDTVSSLRSWAGSPSYHPILGDWDARTQFRSGPNEWWPVLPNWINDRTDYVW